MKIGNVENNVENQIRSIFLEDGHSLFRIKKKSTLSTWSYFDIINTKGITLIALIITIIIMLILAGIVISFAIGENGIFKIARESSKKLYK